MNSNPGLPLASNCLQASPVQSPPHLLAEHLKLPTGLFYRPTFLPWKKDEEAKRTGWHKVRVAPGGQKEERECAAENEPEGILFIFSISVWLWTWLLNVKFSWKLLMLMCSDCLWVLASIFVCKWRNKSACHHLTNILVVSSSDALWENTVCCR